MNTSVSQVQDLQRIMSDTEAVLGPDGRVIENGAPQSNSFVYEDKRKKAKVIEGEEYNGPPVTAPESEVELFCNLCKLLLFPFLKYSASVSLN